MKIIDLDIGTPSLTTPATLSDTADSVTGSIFADTAGTLHVEQSGDNQNWDIDDPIPVTASTGAKINVAILLPYVRLRLVPTAAPPTVLRCFARLASAGNKL